MGLLDNIDPDALRNRLRGILGDMPISQLVQGKMQMPTLNGLRKALLDTPKPFDQSPEAMAQAQEVAMAGWNPAGLLGYIADIRPPKWNTKQGVSIPVGIDPTKAELKELAAFEKKNSGYRDIRVLKPVSNGGPVYAWPASSALHQDIGAHFKLRPEDYLPQEWDLSKF